MPLWAFALIVVGALLVLGAVMDWRARRVRRSLERYGGRPEPGVDAGSIDRTAPGTTTQSHGHFGPTG